ncbi:GNAT family N-acetyltransferase [Photobacterium aquimaris]|uniref:N-acetyltransferase n=1 Tax=Photobacterium aquimaris TaxID=512643 RepID=A0A2T3HTI9_9GAMM|nr:GNAT family N-acetyltransferase [Photobacterium aquimaris]OBU21999.1 GNAT family acetyltransferase [Photobacterium aquimaris]PQJ40947.1 GNAT family N-acetyltransferase [Photobacterium aquimaris]PST98386.1 N-acetyltransferase [Photobacterium aquimaris]
MQGFSISANTEDMDLDIIFSFISESYWAKGIPEEILKKAIKNSFCFGVFEQTGKQVGFARLITDRATFAYLADVFILESHRGLGLSKWLISTIVEHQDICGLRRLMLATKDAHGLYAQYGFTTIENPEILMQIWQPNIYQCNGA